MMGERQAPGVQHGGVADASSEMLGVGGDGGQRLGGGPEQKIVDRSLVLERDGADRSRQGEDDVIIGNGQKLRLAVFEPLPRRRSLALRAMRVAAGIVGDARVRAVLAALDVPAERRGPAILDRRHHLQLGEAHVPALALRHAAPWARKTSATSRLRSGGRATRLWSGGLRSLRQVDAQPFQRALDVAHPVGRYRPSGALQRPPQGSGANSRRRKASGVVLWRLQAWSTASTLQARVDLGHPDIPVRIVPCGCDASIRYRRS
jgi:hypothetical protein